MWFVESSMHQMHLCISLSKSAIDWTDLKYQLEIDWRFHNKNPKMWDIAVFFVVSIPYIIKKKKIKKTQILIEIYIFKVR